MQAKSTPELIALRFGDAEITYSELDQRSARLAGLILEQSPHTTIIGISTTRGTAMIIAMLAILKAGKAYLPLDPDFPEERIQQITDDSKIDTCLAPEKEKTFFEAFNLNVLFSDKEPLEMRDLRLPKDPALAYVLYTSGSTGMPKGVCMGHKPLINLLRWQKQNSIAAEGTRTLQFTPLSFDVSFQEIFSTLTTGGTLVLIENELRLDAGNLLKFIEENSIHRLFLPFVALQYLTETADALKHFPGCLREVMTAGEQLKVTPQIRRFFSAIPGCVLFNQYGPTECHVIVTSLRLPADPAGWPALPSIGKTLDHVEILILNDELNLLSADSAGELCISGNCLAEGYLNRPELTSEKFISWEHPEKGVLRVYRTGDLACQLSDGNIEFLGRKDNQVKIRGNRVELGEIEVVLSQIPGVQQAVVTALDDVPGTKRLVAYIISSDANRDALALRKGVEKRLPDYMIPSAFVWLNEFPKTNSGKVDRNALPKPEIKRPDLDVLYKRPEGVTEKRIADLWTSLLLLDKVGADDNFFELGGNSLLAQKTIAVLKQQFGYELPVTKLYQYPTVSGIALYLNKPNIAEPVRFRRKDRPPEGNTDIAVIGMSGRFPGANTVAELWELLKEGKESTHFFTDEELDPHIPQHIRNDVNYVKARGIIEGADQFDADFFKINPRLAELMDPQQRIFLEIAWEALESTGYLPDKYNGTVGVFAGSGTNTYYLNNVLSRPDLIGKVGSFQVTTVNEKDYIAMRTAFELNLKGPAVSVYSACSTSLLAIVQAVESLRKGQCDVALAGAVSITSPINSGHLYEEGAMLSNDGHSRSFDADARGTVFSDGAGVVLLKNKKDAVRDRDTIYAVIKGVGLNNDGSGKASFTAPDSAGQAGAIRMAIEDAGIDASSISYIEAHGTATPLGDPIEIEGLEMAFGPQDKKQFCAIGSIKSNMGHLTHAAGVASLIKAALSLYYKQIPPSLFYNNPNPHIDFRNSPFFVNSVLSEWESDKIRRAGVSSFGVGGTNVHVVLEEHPAGDKAEPSDKPQLIIWSAKNERSLQNYTQRLLEYINKNKGTAIADIAYTLQSTRQDFNSRAFIIAKDLDDLINKINYKDKYLIETKILKESASEVAYIFPGQGSQYVNMGLDIYNQEPVFRHAVDECAEILVTFLKEDIRHVIFPAKNNKAAEEKLNNTFYTQPALFVIEYAMAKLWMSWGIQPAILTGHSIGEFVAAHLSGIFHLNDALKIVSARSRLISGLPGGSMLAVRSEAEKIELLLPGGLSIAAINCPNLCVVSGNDKDIAAFSKLLKGKAVPNRMIKTSHAFHSPMMDGIKENLRAEFESIKLNRPAIPVVSTATGKLMSDTEAMSPAYWVDQLRLPVRFSDALSTLWEDENRLLLEVGPGNVTTVLARQQTAGKAGVAISSFENTELYDHSEYTCVLKAAGQLWQNGIIPDWHALKGKENRNRVDLPNYAFDRKLCWIDLPAHLSIPNPVAGADEHINIPSEDTLQNNKPAKREVLLGKVKKILEEASGIEMQDVTSDMNFIEIGLDSLLLTQVAITLKKEFRLPITFRQLIEEFGSLDLLTNYLESSLPEESMGSLSRHDSGDSALSANSANPAIDSIMQQIQALNRDLASLKGGDDTILDKATRVLSEVKQTGSQSLSPEEEFEIKKPFGATPRIEKQTSELNGSQKKFLAEFIQRYNHKTRGSKEYTQKHRSYMADPRVVSGFKPLTKEITYPIVVKRSEGGRLWDIDGNEYIDALNGFGSNMLGNQPDVLKKAILDQVEKGYEIGPQHELAGEVCRLVCDFTKFDRAAICSTGSEAVLGTMRIARTVTGRSLIVAFTGSYHGIFDEVIVRGTKKLRSLPAAAGIMNEAVQNMLILDYGTDESLKIIRERSHELAAVLVEPVQSRRPEFQPVEFLKEVREITEKSGTVLIFDEVITGFRMHPGGAQAIFDIKADVASYGKVVGGGLPIGIIAGKKQFMDALDAGSWQFGDASAPEAGVTYFAGTFVRHPLVLATAKASLEYFKARGPGLQEELNAKCLRLTSTLNSICEKMQLPVYVVQFGSLWRFKFKEDIPYIELLFTLMREKGIHILEGFPCFINDANTEEDIVAISRAFGESARELIESDFLHPYENKSAIFVKSPIEDEPPVTGARLGRDKDGNPAWFIEDPKQSGKYMQIAVQKLNNGRN